jgi:acetolactate synthase-1/2/3 large subunit
MSEDLGDRLARVLLAGGIEAAFGVPGGQTLPFYAATQKHGLRHVMMRDERAAACAADAYARISGRVGVCDATVGPGVTNLVSGLAEAFASSIPVLAIIADVPTDWGHLRRRSVASQAMDQQALLAPVSKWIARVERSSVFDEMLDQALRVATSGRPGPVVLEIPDDVFQEPVQETRRIEREAFSYPRLRAAPAEDVLERAAELIARARRPLLLCGGGVPISGACAEVAQLAEASGIPVATTLNGKGSIDERHPLSAGVVGVFGNVRGGRALHLADLVIALGSKLDQLSTFNWRLPRPDQKLVHIDVDAEEIGRSIPVELGVVADARSAAVQLAERLKGRSLALESGWLEGVSATGQPGTAPDDPHIAPERVVQQISDLLGPEDLLLCDASLASGWGAQHFRVKRPGRGFIAPRGLAGIGWAGGAAIGAHLGGAPGQRLVCLAGDGGWAYSLSEIETAVRHALPITYVVLNNSSLGWIRHTQQHKGMPDTADFGNVDFAGVARAMGAQAESVTREDEIQPALVRALAHAGPYLLDARTSPDASPNVGLRRVTAPEP